MWVFFTCGKIHILQGYVEFIKTTSHHTATAQPPPETSYTQLSRQAMLSVTAVFLHVVTSQINGHISHGNPRLLTSLFLTTLLRKAVDIIYARSL